MDPEAWRNMKVQKSQQRKDFLISKQLSRELRVIPEAGTTSPKPLCKPCGRTSFWRLALSCCEIYSIDLCSTKVGSKEPAAAAGSFAPTNVFRDAILELSEAFKAEFCVQGQCRPGRLDILQRILRCVRKPCIFFLKPRREYFIVFRKNCTTELLRT